MFAYLSWRVDVTRELFGVTFFPHGVLIAVGILAGGWVLTRYARREGVGSDVVIDMLTWVVLGSIVGTRLVWALGNLDHFESPAEVLMIWHGGMTLYGGILGGLIVGVILLRRRRLPVLRMLDAAAPGLALGLLIGRISDLITGDHLGTPTDLPWGFRYVGTDPPGHAPRIGEVVHFVALYDVVLVAVLLGVLVLFHRRRRAAGSVAALFAVYYSADRILLDFLRTDRTRLFGLTGTQLASIVIAVVVATWLLRRQRSRPTPPAGVIRAHEPEVASA